MGSRTARVATRNCARDRPEGAVRRRGCGSQGEVQACPLRYLTGVLRELVGWWVSWWGGSGIGMHDRTGEGRCGAVALLHPPPHLLFSTPWLQNWAPRAACTWSSSCLFSGTTGMGAVVLLSDHMQIVARLAPAA